MKLLIENWRKYVKILKEDKTIFTGRGRTYTVELPSGFKPSSLGMEQQKTLKKAADAVKFSMEGNDEGKIQDNVATYKKTAEQLWNQYVTQEEERNQNRPAQSKASPEGQKQPVKEEITAQTPTTQTSSNSQAFYKVLKDAATQGLTTNLDVDSFKEFVNQYAPNLPAQEQFKVAQSVFGRFGQFPQGARVYFNEIFNGNIPISAKPAAAAPLTPAQAAARASVQKKTLAGAFGTGKGTKMFQDKRQINPRAFGTPQGPAR